MPPNSESTSPTPPNGLSIRIPIVLKIRGVGDIPGFKNRKRIVGKRLITEPKIKRRMQAIQRAIECELRSVLVQNTDAISTGAQLQSLIASLPHDDCWTVISDLPLTGELVAEGEEGCDITIERLP